MTILSWIHLILADFPVKIGLIGGEGGVPEIRIYWNTPIFVTWEPVQKFITLAAFFVVEKQWPQKIGVILPCYFGIGCP